MHHDQESLKALAELMGLDPQDPKTPKEIEKRLGQWVRQDAPVRSHVVGASDDDFLERMYKACSSEIEVLDKIVHYRQGELNDKRDRFENYSRRKAKQDPASLYGLGCEIAIDTLILAVIMCRKSELYAAAGNTYEANRDRRAAETMYLGLANDPVLSLIRPLQPLLAEFKEKFSDPRALNPNTDVKGGCAIFIALLVTGVLILVV